MLLKRSSLLVLVGVVVIGWASVCFGAVEELRVAGSQVITGVSGLPVRLNYQARVPASALKVVLESGKTKMFWRVVGNLTVIGSIGFLVWDIYDLYQRMQQEVQYERGIDTQDPYRWEYHGPKGDASLTVTFEERVATGYFCPNRRVEIWMSDCARGDGMLWWVLENQCVGAGTKYYRATVKGRYSKWCDPNEEKTYTANVHRDIVIESWKITDGGGSEIVKTWTRGDWERVSVTEEAIKEWLSENSDLVGEAVKSERVSFSESVPSNAIDMGSITVTSEVDPILDESTGNYVDPLTGSIVRKKEMTKEESENTTTLVMPSLPMEPIFDTSVEIPEKNNIQELLEGLENHPVINLINSIRMEASAGQCSFSITNPFGVEGQIDFCQYQSLFAIVGGIILTFGCVQAVLIMVRV